MVQYESSSVFDKMPLDSSDDVTAVISWAPWWLGR